MNTMSNLVNSHKDVTQNLVAAIFNGIQRDACANLKMIWQRDLGCEWTDEEWARIIAESGRYIREARGKCTPY